MVHSDFFSRVGALLIIVAGAGLALSAFFTFFEQQENPGAPAVPVEENGTLFTSEAYAFSVRYPSGFTPREGYRYEALGPGREISGVAFRVPAVLTDGTNLSEDSSLSVEVIEDAPACGAGLFVGEGAEVTARTDARGRVWSAAEAGDAGAGNQYQFRVSALASGSRCYGLRLFTHTTRLENYDPGTVAPYDAAALEAAYATFLASFTPTP